MSDTPICDDLAVLLAMAPGHTFQDRDAWEKLARSFEEQLSKREIVLEVVKKARTRTTNIPGYRKPGRWWCMRLHGDDLTVIDRYLESRRK